MDPDEVDDLFRLGGDPAVDPQELASAIGAAFQTLDTADLAEALVRRLATDLVDAPTRPDVAGMVALCCGSLVEQGCDPSLALGPILDRLEAQVVPATVEFVAACYQAAIDASAPQAAEAEGEPADDPPEPVEAFGEAVGAAMPIEAASHAALEPMSLAAIAMLARSPELRAEARGRVALRADLDRLGGQYGHAGWLWMMMQVLDEELIVLHPAQGRGYRVRIAGLGDNFQLHTLLADALIGDPGGGWLLGERPNPATVAAAREAEVAADLEPAVGVFNLWNWTALRPDGTLPEPREGRDHWIWGEGVPADIRPFEGTRVVLLGPPAYARSWNSGRKFPAMAGDLAVERVLIPAEYAEIVNRIARAPRPAGPA